MGRKTRFFVCEMRPSSRPAVVEFAEAVAEVSSVAVEYGFGFVVGEFAASQFADEGVEEFVGGFQFQHDGKAAAAMDGDDEAGGVGGGGADR